MFLSALKKELEEARRKLKERLKRVRSLLLRTDLDDKVRGKLQAEEKKIVEHMQTRIKKINGGP